MQGMPVVHHPSNRLHKMMLKKSKCDADADADAQVEKAIIIK